VALGVCYAVRMVADSGTGLQWLRWATPLGWVEELQPLSSPRPLVLLPIGALAAVLAGLSVYLAGQRDLGAGILQAELDTRRRSAELTRQEWERCCAEAGEWLLRATLLGGERVIRLAAEEGAAEVGISYVVTAGVRYPDGGSCIVRQPVPWAGAATAEARRAHQAALEAAIAHAAAAAALRLIEAEVTVTRYRLHAIKDRWSRLGMGTAALYRVFATFNVAAPGFEAARAQATTQSPPAGG